MCECVCVGGEVDNIGRLNSHNFLLKDVRRAGRTNALVLYEGKSDGRVCGALAST